MEGTGAEAMASEGTTRRRRRDWTAEEKRRIVRASREPGVMLREVARRHGVHVSVLTRWRREHSGGSAAPGKARLLRVRVAKRTAASTAPRRRVAGATATARDEGAIEVQFTDGRRLTVRGRVEGGILRAMLEQLGL